MSSRSETWSSGPVATVRQNESRVQWRRKKAVGRNRDPEMERERIRH